MTTKQERIAAFIEKHHLVVFPHEVGNTSELYQRTDNRCFECRLSLEGKEEPYEYLYAYTGLGITEMSPEDMLWWLIEEAERYGGWEDFKTWNYQNDHGYYERELGLETAKLLYQHCRETYDGLLKVLGEDRYEELWHIAR